MEAERSIHSSNFASSGDVALKQRSWKQHRRARTNCGRLLMAAPRLPGLGGMKHRYSGLTSTGMGAVRESVSGGSWTPIPLTVIQSCGANRRCGRRTRT